jgi:hypothetical protein
VLGQHTLAVGVEVFGDDANALFLDVVGVGEQQFSFCLTEGF